MYIAFRIDCLISRLIHNFFLSEYICTPTIKIITIKGATIISIKNQWCMVMMTQLYDTNITPNPVDVAIAASILRCIRANTDDI
jgi:hypothetical protein